MSESQFAIGIDLGTTHCALASVDLTRSGEDERTLTVLSVPQLTMPGVVEARTLLPSFLYLPHPDEMKPEDLALPWGSSAQRIVGELARERGAQTPIRLVSSAKSWLCHSAVDRRGTILPPDAPPEVPRVSPLDASVGYLAHLRDAWNNAHPDAPLHTQRVTITIPASFDPAARELTAEAARQAGIADFTLLEEPQAALYSWIERSAGKWRKQVIPGDVILVVDLGGGTADFSLMAVGEQAGALELHRVAVGDHILLGGDNMDLALAHVVAGKLAQQGTRLEPWQLRALTYGCRKAKESLLSDSDVDSVPIVVPSRGSKLIGGSLRTELTRQEVTTTLVEGFFPHVEVNSRPVTRARAALTQIGLPYAQDAAITRHLAYFLQRQRDAAADLAAVAQRMGHASTFLHPTAVLFNGGVFKSPLLVQRIMTVINAWLAAEGAAPARHLEGADLDLAVARGGAYYGYVRTGQGVRIRGGTAQSYYVGIESSMPAVPGMEPPVSALCVAPFGMEEGTQAQLPPQQFGLVVGEPVRFRFFGSSVRRHDQVGALLEDWPEDELQELGEIEATLPAEDVPAGEVVPVHLRAAVLETGTLQLEAVPVAGHGHWKVEFDVRSAA